MRFRLAAVLRHPRVRRWGAEFRQVAFNRTALIIIVNFVVIIGGMTQLAFVVVNHWSERDIDARSSLVFRSLDAAVLRGLNVEPQTSIQPYFQRLVEDERLLALGYCDPQGRLRYATREMPGTVECPTNPVHVDSFYRITDRGRPISVGVFPVLVKDVGGELLVLNDLSFVLQRAHEAQLYMALALVIVAAALAILGAVAVFALMRGWTKALRSALANAGSGPEGPRLVEPAVGREIESLLTELRLERRYANGIYVEWSPDALHQLLKDELPGAQVMVVSNREPYIHNRGKDGELRLQIPASGLVSAMEPVMRACGGVWIAHGSGNADREMVDRNDRLAVPPDQPAYSLRRVWLTEEEQDGYYYGFANEGMWPLCHIAFVRPIFRQSDWAHYVAVNRRFADAVVEEAQREDPIVLIQDYHFAMLPRMIRQRLPRATIITFWHIPWPNSETFGICPWREAIIDGLLGSSIVGFHTRFHCNNFIEGVDRFIESRIDRERNSVALAGQETLIRPYPISIEWPPAALARQAPIADCRRAVIERFGLNPDVRIAVGIERFDYTKGIVDRMRAVDMLLERRPEWRGKFVFIQAAAPTRSKLDAYSALQDAAIAEAADINAKYGDGDYKPIVLSVRHHEPDEVFEMFRATDLCIVSSLHDGMNLVSKEFVAARDDEQGVLLLSSFAGASRELAESVIVNPYDAHGMADALDFALRMPPDAQRIRMRAMRDFVRQRNVHLWAGQMLLDAARLRRRAAVAATAI